MTQQQLNSLIGTEVSIKHIRQLNSLFFYAVIPTKFKNNIITHGILIAFNSSRKNMITYLTFLCTDMSTINIINATKHLLPKDRTLDEKT